MPDIALVCPLCSSSAYEHFIRGFDRLRANTRDFDYVRCRNCDLVYQYPIPSEREIPSLYIEEYKPYKTAEIEKIERRRGKVFNRYLIKNVFDPKGSAKPNHFQRLLLKLMGHFAMRDTLRPYGQCRLLDVGCGNGAWIYKHHLLGWQAEGVEINLEAAQGVRQKGVPIYHGTLFDVPAGKTYDLITFRHVLEHVPNPVQTLQHARTFLTKEGRIILLLPNLDSYGFREFGNCWYPLDPPRHLLQFTPATISKAGQQAGLKLVSLSTQAQPRMICFSKNYRRIFGSDYTQIQDLQHRQELVARNAKIEQEGHSSNKLLRKLYFFNAYLQASRGRGETMRVVFEKA